MENKKKLDSTEQIKNELNTRKKIALVSLVVILALAIIGTVAWFIATQKNDFTGQNISVKSDTDLQMSLDGTNFAYELSLNTDRTADNKLLITDETSFRDLTGNGVTLRRPALSQTGDTALPDDSGIWTEMAGNTDLTDGARNGIDYISFDLWFKVDGVPSSESDTTPYKVFLTNNSSVTPANSQGTLLPADPDDEADTYNKSFYGTFSRDSIIGAARISAAQSGNLKFVWIPRPDIALSNSIETVEGVQKKVWAVTEGNTSADEDYDAVHTYRDASKEVQTLSNTQTIAGVSELPSSASPITKAVVAELTYNSTAHAYIGKTNITIWVEGCDREARRATAGGEFNVSLQFASFK